MRGRLPLLVILLLVCSFLVPSALATPSPDRRATQSSAGPTWSSDRAATRTVPQRWIVRLKAPALVPASRSVPQLAIASLRSQSTGKFLLDAPAALTYRRQLEQAQTAVFSTLQAAFPVVQLHHRYQILFNGLGILLPGADDAAIARIRAMPEVAAVYPDRQYEPTLFSSLTQIGAPALWNNAAIGGAANAGAGMKIAVIDSGIRIDNAFFNPAGFAYPAGFPKGHAESTTPKVIAARAYFRPDLPPLPGGETPQPGPLESSHGTHVAGIAAGVGGTNATFHGLTLPLSGVAPRAYLMNYKVFYENDSLSSGSAATIELLAALEDAVADGADVINNSWGSRADVEPHADPLAMAAEAAVDAGVTVVFSAGNEGPNPSTAGSPGFSDKLIAVGATTTGQTLGTNFVDVVAPEGAPEDLKGRNFLPASFGVPLAEGIFGPAFYVPVAAVTGSSLACEPLPPGSLGGHIALVERGTCAFSVKVFNAQQGGASAVMVYNSEAGGEAFVLMGPDQFADEVTIPALFIQRSLGLGLIDWLSTHGDAARIQLDTRARVLENSPDVLTGFSSRGPTFQGTLKPDVVAPGFNILSSGFASGEGDEVHMGFGTVSGTSMAAPHVAGAAALLKQVHPAWSPADIKSALMSTASTEVMLDEERTEPASITQQGAGRVDLARAVDPGLLFDRPNLSYGRLVPSVEQPTRATLAINARNATGQTQTFTLSGRATGAQPFTIGVSPATLTLEPGQSEMLAVTIELPPAAAAGNYEGLVEINGPQALHLPLLAVAMQAQRGPTVLLLDNDGSTSLEFPDYAAYYTQLLDQLAVPYTYYDLDALAGQPQSLPDLAELQRHAILVWFTGDNFVPSGALPVPTPLTPNDQDLLISYLQAGGNLIATGQDLSFASDINAGPDPAYQRSDLFHAYLGARFVQDDVYTRTLTLDRAANGTTAAPWLGNIVLDLSAPGGEAPTLSAETSAGNQVTVDEIGLLDSDPRLVDTVTTPILRAVSTGAVDGGIIGLNRSSEPTLESSGRAFPYRTTYLSFGLEGVRNDTGTTTRAELLQALLYWHVDRPEVTVSGPATITDITQLARFTATATTNTPAEFVRYRWDFGDGSPIVDSVEPVVVHQYAQTGTYQVRVEAINSWGHHAISSGVSGGGETPEPGPTPPDVVPSRLFPETNQSLQGRFLEFWQDNGGLAVFGYPLAAQTGGTPTSQVLERARFELHPGNPAPYDVLLGHLGLEALAARGQAWQDFPQVAAAPEGCLYFAETGHSLCGSFRTYWESHGLEFDGRPGSSYAESLALFGLPLSEPQVEVGEDGRDYTVQWFERARFEAHPENPAPYNVLLGRLGSEAQATR